MAIIKKVVALFPEKKEPVEEKPKAKKPKLEKGSSCPICGSEFTDTCPVDGYNGG
jgi:transcription elongation factor Elf1